MEIRAIQSVEIEAARQLLVDNGWAHRVGDPGLFRQLIANSQRALVAVKEESVIGFARAISDGFSNGYLSMVAVDAAHRREGVGTALVRAIMGDDPRLTWVLRAGRPEERPFFEKLGFIRSEVAMEHNRAPMPPPENR